MADKPDFVGPCCRCGRPLRNPKMIGSLLVGRVCWKKMLAEGFSEKVHRCPLCHQELPDDHKLTVKDNEVVLESTVRRRSLDEFVEVADGLLSVEVVQDEKREGKGHDRKTANSGADEGGRGDGSEDVDGARGSDGQAKAAKEVPRKDSDSSEPSEDA